jgi:outer membrane protein TolC
MRCAIVLLAVLAAPAAPAQDVAAPTRLTLDAAVERARAASPRLARLAALEDAARAQAKGVHAERWPQIELGAGYTYRSDVPELTIVAPTGDPAQPVEPVVVFPNIQDNWRLQAGVVLPLWTGGRIGGQIEAAEHEHAAAGQDVRVGEADLAVETKTAYWALVTSRERSRVLRDAIRSYDAHLEDTRNRQQFGLAARNEVLAVQVERDRAELDQLRADAAADRAQANLHRLLDLPPSAAIETVEPLAAPALPPAEVDDLVAEAQATLADRHALVARVAAAEAFSEAERGTRRPQVAMTGRYSLANPNRDIVPPTADWTDTWDLGVGVAWNVLDGGRRAAAAARAVAQADAAREELRGLDRLIRLEITERVLELRTAAASLAVAERSVESAAEGRRVAGDRYREGLVPSAERLDAEVAHERAVLARTEALAALRLAAARLDRAVGR